MVVSSLGPPDRVLVDRNHLPPLISCGYTLAELLQPFNDYLLILFPRMNESLRAHWASLSVQMIYRDHHHLWVYLRLNQNREKQKPSTKGTTVTFEVAPSGGRTEALNSKTQHNTELAMHLFIWGRHYYKFQYIDSITYKAWLSWICLKFVKKEK